MALNIKIIKKKDYMYLIELSGSLDTETQQQFEEEVKEIVDGKTKTVVIDMGGVHYITSAGIAAIVWAKRELKNINANLSMVNLQPQIKEVLDVMKILPMIDIFDDMQEADKYIDQIIKEELEKNKA